ncbi:hypothetical protein KIN20_034572 [Parelaphostrongylus tenuis]|uniref:MSP domain-containing protein n=1 Tax=Parelaphostrongylus tenuis TaxID=148309 RepID=A0AAD5WK52_PARTN|nr:hypothetical protein KIN20_034572 [Parelaphostrongylus tenuis]
MSRIWPPVGALKPDDDVAVPLTFNAGKTVPDNGKHYSAVYYIKVTDEKRDEKKDDEKKDEKNDEEKNEVTEVFD